MKFAAVVAACILIVLCAVVAATGRSVLILPMQTRTAAGETQLVCVYFTGFGFTADRYKKTNTIFQRGRRECPLERR